MSIYIPSFLFTNLFIAEIPSAAPRHFQSTHSSKIVLAGARRAMEKGVDIRGTAWLTVKNGQPAAMDFAAYVRDITCMKAAPAFDGLTMTGPENNLFGTPEQLHRHFTAYSTEHRLQDGSLAPMQLIKLLNPIDYLEDPTAAKAAHWRIRHGACDRDTSLAVSAILTLKLREHGCSVDYHAPWDIPHADTPRRRSPGPDRCPILI